jgi:hypothetical protein
MDPNLPTGETMSEGSDVAPAPEGETSEIPAGLVDSYPNVGDTITLKVVATDPEGGMITVGKVSAPAAEEGGSDAMAAEFENSPNAL